LNGFEADFFAMPDQPDQVVIGLIMHYSNHYVSYRRDGNIITFFDSFNAPAVCTYDELCQAAARQGATLFQVSAQVNHEPIFQPIFHEYDAQLRVLRVADREAILQSYANFRDIVNPILGNDLR
jgi:hypothetical protein